MRTSVVGSANPKSDVASFCQVECEHQSYVHGKKCTLHTGSPKNPYADHVFKASNWTMLRRRMWHGCCPSCERLRMGKARDQLLCWAGWVTRETGRAPFLSCTSSTIAWFRICNTGEQKEQGWNFRYQLHSDLFYDSLGVMAVLWTAGFEWIQTEKVTDFSFPIDKKKKKK